MWREGRKESTVPRFTGHLALTRRMFISCRAGRCIWFRWFGHVEFEVPNLSVQVENLEGCRECESGAQEKRSGCKAHIWGLSVMRLVGHNWGEEWSGDRILGNSGSRRRKSQLWKLRPGHRGRRRCSIISGNGIQRRKTFLGGIVTNNWV